MAKKPPTGDPLYKRGDWKQRQLDWAGATHCMAPRCICPLGRTLIPGHRLWGQDVGHIVSKREGRLMGWTDEQLNTLSNTRVEHRRCNRHAGAKSGARARWSIPTTRTSGAW